jgi:hypothetical protein
MFIAYLVAVAIAAVSVAATRLYWRATLGTVAFLVVWLAYAGVLGVTGVASRIDVSPPGIALLAGPAVVAVLLITLSRLGARLAERIPLFLLIGFQVYRVGVEFTLQHLSNLGMAPRLMTLGGGNIEVLVAVTAPVAAWLSTRGHVGRMVAWTWNVVGLLSLANIVCRAVLSAPGPLRLVYAEVPDTAILTYPFTFIPGFMAPLALALHVLAFRAFRVGQYR